MSIKGIITTTIFATLLWGHSLYGQAWLSAASWGGPANESLEAMAPLPDGRILVGGTFSGQVGMGPRILQSFGGEDIFIAALSPGSNPELLLHLGGPGQDLLTGMGGSSTGGIFCGGVFWQQLSLPGGEALKTSGNPKAIFVARFAPGPGRPLEWARVIEGGNVKELCAIAAAPDGGLLLAGYFSDTLVIDTTRLVSAGKTDAFVIRIDRLGRTSWARRFGGRGDVRIKSMVLAAGETLVITGVFNDQATFGNAMMTANTRDWDIFLAAMDIDGTLRWARKAGGVYDDEVHAVAADQGGNIYLTGQFIGVLDLGPGQGVQSQDGNADAFVLKYHPNGTPLWGKVLGGDQLQVARAIAVQDSLLAVTGYFQENLRLDGQTVSGSNIFNGFFALLRTDGKGRDLIVLPGARPVFPESVLPGSGQLWTLGGVYQGTPQWGGLSLPLASGGFDIFLAQWGSPPVQLADPPWAAGLRVFPNPAAEGVWVKTHEGIAATLSLFDVQGRLVVAPRAGDFLPMAQLPQGPYLLGIRIGTEMVFRRILLYGK
ncbi:MAG: T9SS type A sorting domain-containing protein [Saprospiraceae bacterium]|jgi:hypothetical protein